MTRVSSCGGAVYVKTKPPDWPKPRAKWLALPIKRFPAQKCALRTPEIEFSLIVQLFLVSCFDLLKQSEKFGSGAKALEISIELERGDLGFRAEFA